MTSPESNTTARSESATMTVAEIVVEMSLDKPVPATGLVRSDAAKRAAIYKLCLDHGIKKVKRGIFPRGAIMKALGVK